MRISARTRIWLGTLLLSGEAWCLDPGPDGPTDGIQRRPEELTWTRNPGLHGLQTATLAGNPAAPAPYAERIKLPAHARLAPHSHPNTARMVTVLAGTLYYADGDHFDEAKLKSLPPGQFLYRAARYAPLCPDPG